MAYSFNPFTKKPDIDGTIEIGVTSITGGTDQQILFNNADVVGGDNSLLWNTTSKVLTFNGTFDNFGTYKSRSGTGQYATWDYSTFQLSQNDIDNYFQFATYLFKLTGLGSTSENLSISSESANTAQISSTSGVAQFTFSGMNLIADTVIAYKAGSQPYIYAYDTTLSKFLQFYTTSSYGIINSNTSIIIGASAPSTNNIIFQNIMAQADVATTGTTPASIWFSQSSTSGLGSGNHSMIQQDIDKDQTSWLTTNGLFQDITADFALGTHINQAATSNKSTGLVLGIHGTNLVGQFNAIDSTSSWVERTFVYGTGSNNLFEVNINRSFDATDPSAAGSSSGTSYTGHVWSLKDNGTEKTYIDYTGDVHQQSSYIANGGKIDFASGDITVTHSSNLLTVAGGVVNFSDTITLGTESGKPLIDGDNTGGGISRIFFYPESGNNFLSAFYMPSGTQDQAVIQVNNAGDLSNRGRFLMNLDAAEANIGVDKLGTGTAITALYIGEHTMSGSGTLGGLANIYFQFNNSTALQLTSSALTMNGSFQCDSIVNDTGLSHGTYTPTGTAVSGIDSVSSLSANYMRVGNTVHVSGTISVDATTASTIVVFGVSLPIASNFTATTDCYGVASNSVYSGLADADTTNDRANFSVFANADTAQTWKYSFQYIVK